MNCCYPPSFNKNLELSNGVFPEIESNSSRTENRFFFKAKEILWIFQDSIHKIGEGLTYRKESFIKNVTRMSGDEKYLLDFLFNHLNLAGRERSKFFMEILKGGYVQLDDEGITYEDWKENLKGRVKRISSHESCDAQYSIQGRLVGEFLFSVKEVKDSKGNIKRYTWFQLERYPTRIGFVIRHLWTWVLYKVHGKNYGPYGSSYHREKFNPLQVRLQENG